jgi:hypothetical protein
VELGSIDLGGPNCVELDCIGFGGKLCVSGLYIFGGKLCGTGRYNFCGGETVWKWTLYIWAQIL